MRPELMSVPLLAAASVALGGCSGPLASDAGVDPDADCAAAADADKGEGPPRLDSDVLADGDYDGPLAGSLTHVVTELGMITDRMCDADGDGLPDNAVAGLGEPSSDLFAGAISLLLQNNIDADHRRVVSHLPWVDDLLAPADESAVLMILAGEDTDSPSNPEDDFSGAEPFYAADTTLDACGEPTSYLSEVSISDGAVSARAGSIVVPFWYTELVLHRAEVAGIVSPGGVTPSDLRACGCLLVSELGGAETTPATGGLSMLELLLAGGEALGIPGIDGLTPDADLDGDGLERILTDGDHRVAQCIDGDGTVITSESCWRDERVADAFTVTLSLRVVPARFAGLSPGWALTVQGTCDDPPDNSLWDQR